MQFDAHTHTQNLFFYSFCLQLLTDDVFNSLPITKRQRDKAVGAYMPFVLYCIHISVALVYIKLSSWHAFAEI